MFLNKHSGTPPSTPKAADKEEDQVELKRVLRCSRRANLDGVSQRTTGLSHWLENQAVQRRRATIVGSIWDVPPRTLTILNNFNRDYSTPPPPPLFESLLIKELLI